MYGRPRWGRPTSPSQFSRHFCFADYAYTRRTDPLVMICVMSWRVRNRCCCCCCRGSQTALLFSSIEILHAITFVITINLLILQKQGENTQEVMLGTGCFKSGPVSVHITIPRRGFAVGQSVPFTVDVENHSRKKLNVRMALIQVR